MASAEQKKSFAVIKEFRGLNTRANRTAIDRTDFSWLENAQPIGHGNMRIVPQSSPVKDANSTVVTWGANVTSFQSCNLGLKDYLLAFQTNGAAQYFGVQDGVKGDIKTAGFFSGSGVTTAQWKNERVMIGDPVNGLYSWDGNNVVAIGSVGQIGLTNPGAGYVAAPAVTISAPNDANGVRATAVATISSGASSVLGVKMTALGTGYTSVPVVTIAAPQVDGGQQALAVATISSNNVVAVSVTTPGSGYLTAPTVTIAGGAGSGATATAVIGTGEITSITLTEAGTGYTAQPTVTISAAPAGGTNATAIASYTTFKTGTVAVLVTNGGAGYGASGTTTVAFSGGGGSGAAATAVISGDQVTEVIMTNVGTGYTSAPTVTITAPGGSGTTATAQAVVNTSGIVDVSTFSGRAWVAAGRTVYASAAGTYSDFVSVSAVSNEITDSTLHGNIQALTAANNFLYIWGDDSINVFSDVRVDSSGATLFTNTNVSASVGTKLASAIFPYFRAVLFMNGYGVYSLVGSTTSKISDDLDGLFPLIDFTKPVSGGQVLLNNILCAAFSCTYKDPTLGARSIQLVFFEKKWFITSQGDSLAYVSSSPIGGAVTLYGTTSTAPSKLYADPLSAIASTVQTALMPMEDAIRTKQALRWAVECAVTTPTTLNVTIDSESGSSAAASRSSTTISWMNNSGGIVTWANNSSGAVGWGGLGYLFLNGDAQQYGKYLGMTVTSNSAGFTLSTAEFMHELRVRF